MPSPAPRPLFKALQALGLLLLGAVALPAIFGPLALYWWGFARLDELPEPPTQIRAGSELIETWEVVERTQEITVQRLHPWHVFARLALGKLEQPPGEAASYYVSRTFVYESHGRRHPTYDWHLKNHSLTIWLTRHWTAEQLAEQVARIEERRISRIEQGAQPRRDDSEAVSGSPGKTVRDSDSLD